MCGIIGIFSHGDHHKLWSREYLDGMVLKLFHRGNDDRGLHVEPGIFLGHTRLAIIDPSQAGHQPMLSMDGRYVISFNGEIYNFRHLRTILEKRGHRFRSRSDTEVLLAAWAEWDESALERLEGIFAFALFDRFERTLFLVRDELGVKPLFYSIDGRQLIFASEPLAILAGMGVSPEPDPEDLDVYFTFNYLPAPRTGINGWRQLPPGHLLKAGSKEVQTRRYWKPQYDSNTEAWKADQSEHFMELLMDTVKNQLVSDAPLGLFLSGGLDSYAVSLAATSSYGSLMTFTLGFEEKNFDERPVARAFADSLRVSNEACLFSWSESVIYETLDSMGDLLADASCFPEYQLARFARQHVKVVLSGDGGDELLAGYDTYKAGSITPYIRALPAPLRRAMKSSVKFLSYDDKRYGLRMILERLLSAAEEGQRRDHASFRRIFDNLLKKRLYLSEFHDEVRNFDPIADYADLMMEVPLEKSYLAARQHADIIFHLPSILAKVDRMSMAHNLEVRVPLLSKRLVQFCLNLPDEAKRYRGKGKRILREVLKNRIPADALRRPKAGFLPPVEKWFREPGPMMNVFQDHLTAAKRTLGFLNWTEVEKLWEEHRRGEVEVGYALLGILQFINWSFKCRKETATRLKEYPS